MPTKYPYTCEVCNAHWEATSEHFHESHVASDEHRHNKAEADRAELLKALTVTLKELNIVKAKLSDVVGSYKESAYYKLGETGRAAIAKAESD